MGKQTDLQAVIEGSFQAREAIATRLERVIGSISIVKKTSRNDHTFHTASLLLT